MKIQWKFPVVAMAAMLGAAMMSGCSIEDAQQAISVASQVAEILEDTEAVENESLVLEEDETEPAEEAVEEATPLNEEDETDAAIEEESEEMISSEDTHVEELYLDPDGSYDSKDEVALYLYLYEELPSNYMTKKEAQNLGWSGGSLERYAPGKCIGGSNFGNYEGILPSEDTYHECDIDTLGASSRGAKRIVYSNDGDIYYTGDHYETFTLLYTADGPAEEEVVYGK